MHNKWFVFYQDSFIQIQHQNQCVLIVHKISMVKIKLRIQPTYKISPKDV